MNKLIFISSILSSAVVCIEFADFQPNLHGEYGIPIQNYQNNEMIIQSENNLNQNYDLSSNFDQLSIQHPPIEEQNTQSNYLNIPSSDTLQPFNQNSGLEYNHINTQNYFQSPSTDLKSFVLEKSKEIPTDFLYNPSKSNVENIQTGIKEYLGRNYIETMPNRYTEIRNNAEGGRDQQNIMMNLPTIIAQNPNNKHETTHSNQPLPNSHFNFKMESTQQQQTEAYNPSSFGYNNQNHPQINPSRIYFNQFMMKPTNQIPNSKYEIPIMNNNDFVYSKTIPLPQIHYSNDFNKLIYPQVSTYTNRIPKFFNPQISKSKITTKIYAYAAPDETEEEIKDEILKEVTPRHHYNVIFIKAPHQLSRNSLKLIQMQAQKEEKTAIYVLSKKPDTSEIQETLDSVRTYDNKPEVHFIKYKTEDEALLAQHNIKAQYDNIEGSDTNNGISPIQTPSGNYPGNELIKNEINENGNYLPPV